MKKICIIDYGLGNIKSLYNALKYLGFKPEFFSENKSKVFDVIFIPGVGSFSKASELLFKPEFNKIINDSVQKSLIFGICLGMQIFLTKGEENGDNKGLNFFNGEVKILKKNEEKLVLPMVGLQQVKFKSKFNFLEKYNNKNFYFVHSYAAFLKDQSDVLGSTTSQDINYTAAISKGRVFGTQFHPEKSGELGLDFLNTIIENI